MTNLGQVDPLWNHINTVPEFEVQRSILLELRKRYLPFADANFDTELHLNFGSCFWEMYLACALLDRGLPLLPRSQRESAGPDLCVQADGNRIWIEATAPRAGKGADAVPGIFEGNGWIPESQIVLRYRSAVEEKHKKWLKYVNSGIVSVDDPFLVAVNGFQIPDGNNAFPDEVPYQVQSVIPLGAPSVTIDRETGEIRPGFETRWHIEKKSGIQVSTSVFLDAAYAGISGLLFSAAHPLYLRQSGIAPLSHLHNPKAVGAKALPRGWVRIGMEYWVEENQLLRCPLQVGA